MDRNLQRPVPGRSSKSSWAASKAIVHYRALGRAFGHAKSLAQ